ncbi:MAG: metal-dependent hydrolase, partial [Deltaproteobacteria bacterium]|nr:metal-dependent hydrolase [Deltaproteobacteria bacterium]
AIRAVRLIKPRIAIPMHYNTFDVIRQDPGEFKKGLEGSHAEVRIVRPGETVEI